MIHLAILSVMSSALGEDEAYLVRFSNMEAIVGCARDSVFSHGFDVGIGGALYD